MPIRLKLARCALVRENRDKRSYLYRQMSLYGPRNVGDIELVLTLLSGSHQRRQEIADSLFGEADSIWDLSRLSLATLCKHGLTRA